MVSEELAVKLLERVMNRMPDETADNDRIYEYIMTISDRLCLRLGTEELPALFESVCVDAVVKMHRRLYHEGITSEGVTNLSTSFVNDILEEYDDEIAEWKSSRANTGGSGRVVRFL